MAMIMTGEQKPTAQRETVWENLIDPTVLMACIRWRHTAVLYR